MPADETPHDTSGMAGRAKAWKWSGEESMYPFWAVEHLANDDMKKKLVKAPTSKFNCQLKDFQYHAVTVGSYMGSSVAYTLNVTIPGLVNSVPVNAGDVLYWESLPKASIKRKDIGWRDDKAKPATKKNNAPAAPKAKAKSNGKDTGFEPRNRPTRGLTVAPSKLCLQGSVSRLLGR